MIVVIYVLEILLLAAVLYGLYKIEWYIIKIVALKRFAHKLTKNGAVVEKKRGLFAIVFGKKGIADYIIEYKGKKYEISVLSFISSHGRWNIEKAGDVFFIESRRASKIFYKRRVHSGVPDHALEYKGELRVSRKELNITPIDPSFEKQIFLLYPYPKKITYTDTNYNELYVGCEVQGHIIMDVEALKKMLFADK